MDESKNLDLRKWKSQDALKRSFWRLLGEVGYTKITVRNITEDSGLNRKTFYRNFEDMESLMKASLHDLFAELASPFQPFSSTEQFDVDLFEKCTREYILLVQKEQSRLQLIFANHLEGFAQEVWKSMYVISSPDYVILGPNSAPILSEADSLDLYSSYAAFGTWANLEWILRHASCHIDELLRRTMDAYSAYLYNYFVSYRIGERFAAPASN